MSLSQAPRPPGRDSIRFASLALRSPTYPTTVLGLLSKHGWSFSCRTTGFPSSNHPAGIWDGMHFLEITPLLRFRPACLICGELVVSRPACVLHAAFKRPATAQPARSFGKVSKHQTPPQVMAWHFPALGALIIPRSTASHCRPHDNRSRRGIFMDPLSSPSQVGTPTIWTTKRPRIYSVFDGAISQQWRALPSSTRQ